MVAPDALPPNKSRRPGTVLNTAREKRLVAFLYSGNSLWKIVQARFHLPRWVT